MVDLTGKSFGKWLVLNFSHRTPNYYWNCKCDCGTIKPVLACHLKSGKTTNCGCQKAVTAKRTFTKHGQSLSNNGRPTGSYESWQGAKDRCFNKNDRRYSDWGGRGIIVCEKWMTFEKFYFDMGDRPEGKTLDRINVNGNYEPGNCRWATIREQNNNKRKTKHGS